MMHKEKASFTIGRKLCIQTNRGPSKFLCGIDYLNANLNTNLIAWDETTEAHYLFWYLWI